MQPAGNYFFKKISITAIFFNLMILSFGQLNSSSSQTISTNQTYTGSSTIYNNSTVTVSGGTITFNGTLTVGNGGTGALIIQSGATVIINGTLSIGTSSNGAVTVQSGGILIVNPGSAVSTAAININSSAATALDIKSGGAVIVKAANTGNTILGIYQTSASNTSVAGSLQIRGGGFKMDGTAKLTYSGSGNDTIIGTPNSQGAYFSNSSVLTVGASVNLYISGNVNNDSNANFAINGNVSINGNYQSGNTTANVTGSGTISTTGSLNADGNQGTVFGQPYSCSSGPCAGNNTISSTNTTTCVGGAVNITGPLISGATYQWFVSTTSSTSGFSIAPGTSVGQNYSTVGSGTVTDTYYKRQYTLSGQTYNSNTLKVTSNTTAGGTITGTNTICVGSNTTLYNYYPTGGTWSSGTPSVATISASGTACTVTGVSAGTSVISYTVTNGGCTAVATFTMTVHAPGTPTVTTITSFGLGYIVPSGAKSVLIQVWGGGGGGSKGYSNLKGTGGGGGGFSQKSIAAAPGDIITYTVGSGGLGAGTILSTLGFPGNGGDGGTTTATLNSTTVSATGGAGGQSTNAPGGSGGAGGTGIGDFNLAGGSGAILVSPTAATPGGGGGGSAGTLSNGNNAGNTTPGSGSTGGTAVTGGGAGGNGNSSASGNGSAGGFPGGGGGGNAGTGAGGDGGGGKIVITVFYTKISYSSTKFCKTVTSALPTISGVTGGTFSSVPSTGLSINATTGDINPSTSTAGNYTVNYSNSCGLVSSTLVGITAAPTATTPGTALTTCSNSGAINITTGSTASNYSAVAWTSSGTGTFTNASSLTLATYNPSAADKTAGSVTLTLTATGSTDCSSATATATRTLTISAAPTASAGTAIATCSTSGAVSVTTGATATNYSTVTWTSSGTGTFTNAASLTLATYNPSAADKTAGSVTLTLTAVNAGCTNATSTKTLTITPGATAVAGTAVVTCASSGAVNITAGSSATNQSAVAWTSSGAGTFTNANSLTLATYDPSAADIAAGTVTLTLTATGTLGCLSSAVTSTKTITITPSPAAVAGTAVTTCSDAGAVSITAGSGATNYSSVQWTSSGTGTISSGTSLINAKYNPSAADIAAGSVTLTLAATGSSSCLSTTATSTKSFTISPAPTATAGTAVSTCESSGAVNITAGSGATNQSAVAWTSSGTGTFANANSLTLATYDPSAADIAAGSVTLTLTVTGTNYCSASTVTSTKTFTIKPLPAAVAGTAVTTCSNSGAVSITAGSGATNYSSVLWTSSGTGTISSGTSLLNAKYNPSAADIAAGSVTLTLTATGASSCISSTVSSTKSFTISPAPTAAAGATVNTCENSGAVNITAGSGATNQSAVAWTSSGTGTFANANSLTLATYDPSAADIAAGSVTLTLTVTGSGACLSSTATSTKTLTIRSMPTISAGTAVATCSDAGVVSITAGASATNHSSVQWTSSGTGTISSGASLVNAKYNPSAADIAAGSITLTLTATGTSSCISSTVASTKTFTITTAPTGGAGTTVSSCGNSGAVSITAGSSAANYSSVSWSSSGTGSFSNANSLTLATYDPSAADKTAGSVTLTLTVTGSGACSASSAVLTKTFTINAVPSITATTPATRCGAGSVTLSAVSDIGTVHWYSVSTGGSGIATGTSYSPTVSSTTTYYVDATNAGCTTASRTAVVATVDNACAYTWTGALSKAWNVAGNWSQGYVPTSANDVIIPSTVVSGNMPEVSVSAVSRTLSNSGTITLAGSGVLTVYGNINNSGSGTVTGTSGATLLMGGSTAQTITGLANVSNLTISNSAGVSVLSPLRVNGTLSLPNGVLTTNGNLTLNFDSGANIAYNASDAGSISGVVAGTRNLVAKTHYIGSPFAGVTSGQIDASTPIYRSGAWLLSTKTYSTQGWSVIRNYTTAITPGTGYCLAMFSAGTLTMSGTYAHTAVYSSGNYSNTIPSTITHGMYFMMGNPYPSTLDWDNASGWTKTNIDDAVYYWNPVTSSAASYVSGVGTNGGSRYIGAMQSFLVSVTGTGGFASLSVNSNARVLTNASYFRSASPQLVRLVVKNASGSSADETVVRMDDVSSSDFESGSDAYKIHGGLSLYTKNTGSDFEYSINTLPVSGAEMLIPLNLKVSQNGLYTIECREYSVPGYSLVLEDRQTQSSVLLDNSTIYTINASNTDSTNRFVLRFVAGLTTGVVNGVSSDLQISTYDNQLMLNAAGSIHGSDGTIHVYDASGLLVMKLDNQRIASGVQTVGGFEGLSRGVYIVKITLNGSTYVGKVVLK